MIPIRLSLQGVFSYIEKQEIDFTGLTEAGLFGIFGKVGSGKSSIVDAITFVLYNNNFRLLKDQMAYNMMNLSAQTMHIEYDFRVDDALFRFAVSARRNRNNFEDVKPSRSAFRWDNEKLDWIPIDNNAELVIGLSYEDFKRAVIIPQNNFQEFLELKNTERNNMMQKIFRLERFDLSAKVRVLKEDNTLKINTISAQLQELGDINPAQIEALEKELEIIQHEINEKQQIFNALQAESDQWAQLKKQVEALLLKRNKLVSLQEQEKEFLHKRKMLYDLRQALIYIKPLLDRKNDAVTQLSILEKSLEAITEQISVQGKIHEQIVARFNALRTAFENRDGLKIQAEDFERLLKIRQAENDVETLKSRKENGELHCREVSERIEADKVQKKQLELDLSKLSMKEIDIATVTNVLNWFAGMEGLSAQINSEQVRLAELKDEYKIKLQEKNNFNSGLLKGIDEHSPIGFIEEKIASVKLSLENDLQALREKEQVGLQQQLLQQHVHALHHGVPCPLCGSPEHPSPLEVNAGLQEALQSIQVKSEQLQFELRTIDECKEALIKLKYKISNQEDLIRQVEERVVRLNQLAEEEKLKFIWSDYSSADPASAKKAKEEFQLQTVQKKQINEKISALINQIDASSADLIKYQEVIKKFEVDISKILGSAQTIRQLMSVPIETYKDEPTSFLAEKSAGLMKKYLEIADQYEAERVQLNKSEVNMAELNIRLESEAKMRAELQTKTQLIIEELQRCIVENGFDSVEKARDLLNSGIDADAMQVQIEHYFQSLQQAQSEFDAANDLLKGKAYNEAQHNAINEHIQTTHAALDIDKKRWGALDTDIKRSKSNLSRRNELLDSKSKLQLRAENITTLESLFKGKAFVNFASRVYLINLVNIANVRFQKMTQGQLLLQLGADNSFEVLDLLNEGKTRSVKTLSGGQKFQAALCLALALADGISHNHHENFFFLDEGFGSLDKESMQLVFESLLALRKENRVVGLISHVEEMQQEMDRYILVQRDDTRGSWVEVN